MSAGGGGCRSRRGRQERDLTDSVRLRQLVLLDSPAENVASNGDRSNLCSRPMRQDEDRIGRDPNSSVGHQGDQHRERSSSQV